MAIPESQLETWSHQGSVTQSAQTYGTIQDALNDSNSPYYAKDFSIFLQGSYGNDTNVYRDSDVDVVIRLNQTYYADTNSLEPDAKANYDNAFSLATYTYAEFKADVLAWLQKKFGADVVPGKKAIFIKGNGTRRDADVIVCSQHRRYRAASTGVDAQYDEGIILWASDGAEIINFPKQHSANCMEKHQNTSSQFKRIVRVYKNMRNRMIDGGYIEDGIAPSYFLEGMLWNVPNDKFVQSYEESFVNTFNWVLNADKTQLACANDLHWLVRDYANVCWSTSDFYAYLAAVTKYWNDWKT
ncbi:nucleotidyltransferase [Burkholderia sp. Bp9140]|uniref:nucleotidyltransferase domain-containing protein n=1 Tax=Burkholderia sp. Bp9140 TaxID=2184572 RepID=UPI000F575C76|nr:nucleotidyltransferase [Burkholderia sp. Bp9140]RQR55959.1 nucleotidyltransferase [Burkholderia sp. Bp9140]